MPLIEPIQTSHQQNNSPAWWIVFILLWIGIPFIKFHDFLLGHALLGHTDRLDFEFATRSWFFSLLKDGSLSFLYPNSLLGVPLTALVHNGIFYWPNALHVFIEDFLAFRLLYLIHFVAFGIGWTLALRTVRISLPVALTTATILLGSGLFFSFHLRVADLHAVAWSGFTVFLFLKAIDKKNGWLALMAGLFAAQALLAGEPLAAGIYPLMAASLALAAGPLFNSPRNKGTISKYYFLMVLGSIIASFPMLVQTYLFLPLTMRSEGFLYEEALSHSSHFSRIVDLIFPGYLPRPISDAFPFFQHRIGFLKDWWYPSIAIGIPAFIFLVVGALRACRSRPGALYLAICSVFILLAQGAHLPGDGYFFLETPVLKSLRYPEKFLRYPIIFSVPLIALGIGQILQKLKQIPLIAILLTAAVGVIQVQTSLEQPMLIPASSLRPNPAIEKLLADKASGQATRVLVCEHGVPGIPSDNSFWVDTRIYGIGIINGTEGVYSKTLTAIDCLWATSKYATSWLGISHIVTGHIDVQKQRDVITDLLGPFEAYESPETTVIALKDKGPKIAFFSNRFDIRQMFASFRKSANYDLELARVEGLSDFERGMTLIDPSWVLNVAGLPEKIRPKLIRHEVDFSCESNSNFQIPLEASVDFSRLKFRHDFACSGIVSVPWTFMPGWKISLDQTPATGFRVGGITLGVQVPAGQHTVEMSYDPPGYVWMLLVSVGLQLLILWAAFRTGLLDPKISS